MISENGIRSCAADIQITVWTEGQVCGVVQTAASDANEGIYKCSRGPIEAQNIIRIEACDIKVAIVAEGQANGAVQSAAAACDELPD